jgi:large subunit ribosomal protein L10
VVKNTLLERAARGTAYEVLIPHLAGPTAMMTSTSDAIAPARVLVQFIRENRLPAVKVACVEGNVFDEQGVRALSELPTREVLLSMLLRALQGPLSNLVSVLNGNLRDLAQVLGEVAKQKAE